MIPIHRLFLPLLLFALVSAGCDSQDSNGGDDVLADSTLRTLADLNNLHIGAAVAALPFDDDYEPKPAYESLQQVFLEAAGF